MKANYNTMESTIEGNKLIDKFNDYYLQVERGFTEEELNYHSDWNNLMPVVEKIKILGYSIEIYSLGANNKRMAIYSGGVIVVQSRLAESTIEAVYNCVIDFIKWYNGRPK